MLKRHGATALQKHAMIISKFIAWKAASFVAAAWEEIPPGAVITYWLEEEEASGTPGPPSTQHALFTALKFLNKISEVHPPIHVDH